MKNYQFDNLLEKHQELLEVIIRSYNEYAHLHSRQLAYGTSETFSLAQIQVIETVLRGKDNNMKALAAALGITKGSLTKNIKKLEARGLVKRYKSPDNRKQVYVEVTSHGETLYSQYLIFIYNNLFKKVYDKFDEFQPEQLNQVKEAFQVANQFMEDMSRS